METRWVAIDFGGPEVLRQVPVDVSAANPESGPYRVSQRARLLGLAASGQLTVPVARTFPMNDAPAAVAALMGRHPYGKLALVAWG